jgi:energy-converting hydrogenase Eha subunit E
MFTRHVIRQVNFEVAVIYVCVFFLKRGETLACNHVLQKSQLSSIILMTTYHGLHKDDTHITTGVIKT